MPSRLRSVLRRLLMLLPPVRSLAEQRDRFARSTQQYLVRSQRLIQERDRLARSTQEYWTESYRLIQQRDRFALSMQVYLEEVQKLTQEDFDRVILDGARRNLARAHEHADCSLPDPGRRWGGYAARIKTTIEEFRTIVEVVRYAQIHVGFEMRAVPPLRDAMVQSQLEQLLSRYPGQAEALRTCCESALSNISHPEPVATVGESRYTTSHLAVVEHMFFITDRLGRFPASVLEIGGGYGVAARAWLISRLGRLRRFAILDLPESLFFAEVFLKAHFGLEAVVNLADPDASARADQAVVLLCPVQCMGLLERFEFDVVMNTGSMQEMPEDWVTVYGNFLSALRAQYFYSANYFLQPLNRMNESMNLWSPRVPAEWALQDHEFWLASVDADFRGSLRAFYRREGHCGAALEDLAQSLERLEGRAPNAPLTQREGRDLALLMDAFRRRPEVEPTLRLVRILATRFPVTYKELAFLVKWLLEKSEALHPADVAELASLDDRLNRLRASGNEGLS